MPSEVKILSRGLGHASWRLYVRSHCPRQASHRGLTARARRRRPRCQRCARCPCLGSGMLCTMPEKCRCHGSALLLILWVIMAIPECAYDRSFHSTGAVVFFSAAVIMCFSTSLACAPAVFLATSSGLTAEILTFAPVASLATASISSLGFIGGLRLSTSWSVLGRFRFTLFSSRLCLVVLGRFRLCLPSVPLDSGSEGMLSGEEDRPRPILLATLAVRFHGK